MRRAEEIIVAGQTFHCGPVTEAMRLEAKPHIDFLVMTVKKGWPVESWAALRAAAQISAIFFREYAPDVNVDWLMKNMTAREWEIVALEFTRRALDDLSLDYRVAGTA